jgi:osmotically-inducible protein OsmY
LKFARATLIGSLLSLLLAAGCASTTKRSPEQVKADDDLQGRVYAAIVANDIWYFPALRVQARDGTVYLTGLTFDAPARDAATDIAKSVKGVKAVTNTIEVSAGR